MKEGFCEFKESMFAYFDYAATTFMPQCVIEKQNHYNRNIGVSSNRGKGTLSSRANEVYAKTRAEIKRFFTENDDSSLIFYRGATYAINEIAYSLEHIIEPMDIILLGPYEHHSNYLPWRELCRRKGAILFEIPLLDGGKINMSYLEEIASRVKILAFSSVANTNGYKIVFRELEKIINDYTIIIVDDSQKCAHEEIEHSERIDCHIVNSHKMYGPKGIAGAIVRERMLDIMHPCMFGGGMVDRMGFPNVWKKGIDAFESGTIDISAAVAWSEACRFIESLGYNEIIKSEKLCYERTIALLREKRNIEIISDEQTTSLLSFVHNSIHAHDIEDAFSQKGVVVRAGHLCSQNSIAKLEMRPLVRISFGVSMDEHDMNMLIDTIEECL